MLRNLSKSFFRIISASFFLLSATSFIQPNVAVAGDFSKTCGGETLEETKGRFYLRAQCEDGQGGSRQPEIAISDYIANYNGNLAWASLGKFHETCENIRIEKTEDGAFLKATCKDGRGGENDNASINLDEKISNQAGVLAPDF